MPDESAPSTKYLRPASEELRAVAVDGGDDIERERLQFETHIKGDQIIGRDHHHHAGGGEQHQHRDIRNRSIFSRFMKWTESTMATAEPKSVNIFITRPKASVTKAPPKADAIAAVQITSKPRKRQRDDRADGHLVGGFAFAEHAEHEKRHGAQRPGRSRDRPPRRLLG